MLSDVSSSNPGFPARSWTWDGIPPKQSDGGKAWVTAVFGKNNVFKMYLKTKKVAHEQDKKLRFF